MNLYRNFSIFVINNAKFYHFCMNMDFESVNKRFILYIKARYFINLEPFNYSTHLYSTFIYSNYSLLSSFIQQNMAFICSYSYFHNISEQHKC